MGFGVGLGIVLLSAGLTYLFRQYALCTKLLDHPCARSSHDVPTPRGGGVAVVATFLGCALFLWMFDYIQFITLVIFWVCGCGVALVGFIDDHYHLPARLRFTVHLTSASLALILLPQLSYLQLFYFDVPFGFVGFFIPVLGLVWLLNLYNFMDGVDGIAGQETIVVTLTAAFIIWLHDGDLGHICLLYSMAAATLGFLVWNWPPAKIFMGDACSGFLGFSLGILALITSASGAINFWSWLILLAYFVIDATITLLRRVQRGNKFYEAHRSHAYQIMARRWQSHKKVTLLVFCLNIVWCVPLAVLASYYPAWGAVITIIAFSLPAILVIMAGAGTTNN